MTPRNVNNIFHPCSSFSRSPLGRPVIPFYGNKMNNYIKLVLSFPIQFVRRLRRPLNLDLIFVTLSRRAIHLISHRSMHSSELFHIRELI